MNRKILATAVAGAIAPMAVQALDVNVSGQVNRAIRFADNGANSDVQHVDGAASGSRLTFGASGEVAPGITAGAKLEYGVKANDSVDVDAPDDLGKDKAWNFRESYLYFSGDFGSVALGWTYPAGNGIEWTTYSGATFGTQYGPANNTGINVMTAGDVPESKGTITSFFPSVTIGRQNTLRYNSPSIGPVSIGASVQKKGSDSHEWTFDGTLSHSVGDTAVKGGVALLPDKLALAGAMQFPQGTGVSVTWSRSDADGADVENRYINLSHTWGNTAVAIGYRSSDDDSTGKEGRNIGLGVTQTLGSGVNVYAGFNNYAFEMPGAELEDINAFHIGSLVTFN
jgi:predicted porin